MKLSKHSFDPNKDSIVPFYLNSIIEAKDNDYFYLFDGEHNKNNNKLKVKFIEVFYTKITNSSLVLINVNFHP